MKSALYLRVSTLHQIDKDSLPMQENDLINYSKYVLGIEDYELFTDAGYSGKDTERPSYQDMMLRIRNGEFTHLLVWKIDRISRNLLDFATMYEELKKHDVTFVSKNEQFDTSSAMGEAMLKIILIFAELERKLTAERVAATMLSRASQGLFNGGVAPTGYKQVDKGSFPIIDDSEASTIRLIFDLYEKHESTHKIRDELRAMGIKTRRGNDFGFKTISEIIRNPFYMGTLRYNYRDMSSPKKNKKPEKEWLLVEDNHEPIISKDQWERCNKIMERNSKRNTAKFRKSGNIHLFSGLLKCYYCGKSMIARLTPKLKDGTQPSAYRCSTNLNGERCEAKKYSIREKAISSVVFQSIADIAQGRKVITTKQADTVPYTLDGKKVEVSYDFIDKERQKYQKALAKLDDLFIFSGMSEKDYLLKKKDIEDKLKELKNKKPANKEKVDDDFLRLASYYLINNEFVNKKKIDYRTIVDNVDRKVLKDFLDEIIHEIKITDGKVTSITYANGAVIVFAES